MAKYGNHLNTIIKQARELYRDKEKNDLSDLPEIIRPYQYRCETHTEDHNESCPKVGFIGRDQDMAYYFDFPGDDASSYIKQIKDAITSSTTRSPMILRSHLEDITKLKAYRVENVGNQSMSFSFADYDIDVYIDQKNLSDVKNNIFFIYYYPTQMIYIFFDTTMHTWNYKELYLKFTPRSKFTPLIKIYEDDVAKNIFRLEKSEVNNYTYSTSESISRLKKIKDLSSYQIYMEDPSNTFRRVPNEHIKNITYRNNRTLNSQQISYFTKKTEDSDFINLEERYVEIEFENIEALKDKENLYLVISDTTNLEKSDSISYGTDKEIVRHTGSKTFAKRFINDESIFNNLKNILKQNYNKLKIIYTILKDANLIYQDHLYFDIDSAAVYIKQFGNGDSNIWEPYQKISGQNAILVIDYYLNETQNNLDGTRFDGTTYYINNFSTTYMQEDSAIYQDNTSNVVFFNYDDTFQAIDSDDTIQCDDIVFFNSNSIPNVGNTFKINEDDIYSEQDTSMSDCVNDILDKVEAQVDTSFLRYLKQILQSNYDTGNNFYGNMNDFIQRFSRYLNFSKSDGVEYGNVQVSYNAQYPDAQSFIFKYTDSIDYWILETTDIKSDEDVYINGLSLGVSETNVGVDTTKWHITDGVDLYYSDNSLQEQLSPFIFKISDVVNSESRNIRYIIPNFMNDISDNYPLFLKISFIKSNTNTDVVGGVGLSIYAYHK